MNINEYIASGVIEEYVLGVLSEHDALEVERMAAAHPEVAQELAVQQRTLEDYAMSVAQTPPPNLEARIMAQLPAANTETAQVGKVVALRPDSNYGFWRAAATVAIIISVASVAGNWWLYDKWNSTRSSLASLEQQQSVLAQELQVKQAGLENYERQLQTISATAAATVVLKGVPQQPNASATVFWNKTSGEVVLLVNNLPAAPEGKQYQLWALDNNQPIDAGMVPLNNDGTPLLKMKNIKGAQAFAITLEPKGGLPAPTLTALTVIGNV